MREHAPSSGDRQTQSVDRAARPARGRPSSGAPLPASETVPLLQAMLESSTDGFCAIGPDAKIIFITERGATMLGWDAASLIGQDAHRAVHGNAGPTPACPTDCPLASALRGGEPARDPNGIFVRRDGMPRPVKWNIAPAPGGRLTLRFADASTEDIHGAPRTLDDAGVMTGPLGHDWGEVEDVAKVGVWAWDISTDEARFSPGLYHIFAIPPGEAASGDELLERVHPEDRARVLHNVRVAAERGGRFSFTHRIVDRDGNVRWMDSHGRTIPDGHGGRQILGVERDITEERASQQALAETSARLTLLNDLLVELQDRHDLSGCVERTLDLLHESFPDHSVAYGTLSPGDLLLVTYPAETGLSPWPMDLHDAPTFTQAARALAAFSWDDLQLDPRFSAERAILAPLGRSLVAMPVAHTDDLVGVVILSSPTAKTWERERATLSAIGPVLSAAFERIRTSVAKAKAEAEMARTTELYNIITENISEVITITDLDGVVLYVSPSTRRTYGYRPEDLIGRRSMDFVHPDDVEHINGVLATMATGQEVPPLTHRLLRGDGSYAWFESSVHIRPHPTTGEPLDLIGVTRDISERRENEQQLDELNRALSSRLEALRASNVELEAFAYSASHDLRAPLRAIEMVAETLHQDEADRLTPEGRENLERILRESHRMSNLIQALLTLSRASRADPHYETLDLTALAQDAWELVRGQDPTRNVRFDVEPGLRAQGDPSLIRTAIQNLLDNAWKYTEGTADPHIVVADAHAEGATFLVRDNGTGFDMRDAQRIFEPFQRLHGGVSGSGVGLATVDRIVKQHQGRIWATSEPGKGATFFIKL